MPNPTVLIEIKTIGGDKAKREISGLKRAVRGVAPATEKMGKAANKASGKMAKLGERTKNLSSSAVLAIGPLSGVGARIVALGSIAQRSALKTAFFLAVLTGLTVILIKAIKRASEAERAMLRLEAVIKATGRTTEISAVQIDEFAKKLGRSTLTSQVAVREAAATLLTFNKVGVEVFEEVLERAQDLAAVFGGDLKSETLRIARALQDPAQGIELLRRRLGNLSPALQFTIKGLSELGRASQAQRIILDELASRVGGAGVAEAGGLAGQVDNLGEAWNEFLEGIGRSGLIEIAVGVIKSLTFAVEGLGDALRSIGLVRPLSTPVSGLFGVEIENAEKRTRLLIKENDASLAALDIRVSKGMNPFTGGITPRTAASREKSLVSRGQELQSRLNALAERRNLLGMGAPKDPRAAERADALSTAFELNAVAIQKFRSIAQDASPAAIKFFESVLKISTPMEFLGDGIIKTAEGFDELNESFRDVEKIKKLPSILSSARTPLQKFNREMEDFNKLMILAPENTELLGQAIERSREKLIATDPILNSFSNGIKSLGTTITDMAIDYENAMDTLRSATFSVVKDILNAFNRLAIVNPVLNALFGIGAQTLTGGTFGSLFGGGTGGPITGTVSGGGSAISGPPLSRAHGGGLRAGQVATVGESGIETWIPSSGGRIVPGAGGQTTIIIDARGSAGTSELEAAVERGIATAAPQLIGAAVISVQDGSGRVLGFLEG